MYITLHRGSKRNRNGDFLVHAIGSLVIELFVDFLSFYAYFLLISWAEKGLSFSHIFFTNYMEIEH